MHNPTKAGRSSAPNFTSPEARLLFHICLLFGSPFHSHPHATHRIEHQLLELFDSVRHGDRFVEQWARGERPF